MIIDVFIVMFNITLVGLAAFAGFWAAICVAFGIFYVARTVINLVYYWFFVHQADTLRTEIVKKKLDKCKKVT